MKKGRVSIGHDQVSEKKKSCPLKNILEYGHEEVLIYPNECSLLRTLSWVFGSMVLLGKAQSTHAISQASQL